MRGLERREQILAIAGRLFARSGFEWKSLGEVAAAAAVTKPLVYRHFDGKRELYLAVLEDQLDGASRSCPAARHGSRREQMPLRNRRVARPTHDVTTFKRPSSDRTDS